MKHYLAHHYSAEVMKLRLGQEISLETIDYNQSLEIKSMESAYPFIQQDIFRVHLRFGWSTKVKLLLSVETIRLKMTGFLLLLNQ